VNVCTLHGDRRSPSSSTRALFPPEVKLSEGRERSTESARGSRRKQLFSERPSGSFTSGGFPKEANVLREASPLAAFRRKRTCFRPSASSRRKGVLRFLREASPLAGWRILRKGSPLAGWRLSEGSRRKRTCFEKSASFGFLNLFPSFGFLPKEGRPSLPSGSFTSGGVAAFRRTPKDALPSGGSKLVLKKARPSASSRRKGVLRFLPKEGRPSLPSGSFTSGGVAAFRRKRTCFASFGFLRKASPLALPSESFTSGGFL